MAPMAPAAAPPPRSAAPDAAPSGAALLVMHVIAGDRLAGGMEIFLGRLVPALHRAGVLQLVVTQRDPELAAHLTAAGIATARLPLGKRDLATWWGLRRLAWRFGPDVVVSWLPRAGQRVPAGPWRHVAQVGLYETHPRCFRTVDRMVVPTPDMARHYAERGFPAGRIAVLPHFTDQAALPPADRAALATPADAPVVLGWGRLAPIKGFDVAMRALAALPGVHLWLAGEGGEEPALHALAAGLGVADRVRFLGWRRDIPALLAAADAAVVPSRREPFGLVFLEAWQAGTPVVATASEGARHLLRHGESGMIAPVEDAAALAAHLSRVLGDPALRQRLAAGGRDRLRAAFTEAVTVQAYRDFFEQVRGRAAAPEAHSDISARSP